MVISLQYKQLDGYKVYNNGKICNRLGQTVKIKLNKTINNHIVRLKHNKKCYTFNVEKLLFNLFFWKSPKNSIMIHMDDNIHNLHIMNLFYIEEDKIVEYIISRKLDPKKQWKPIFGHIGYIISNYGDVYSYKSNKFIYKTYNDGYVKVYLNENKQKFVHRLVYSSFHNKELDKSKCIDHIDNNRANNNIENLREVTHSENSKNRNKKERENHTRILQFSLDNEFIKEWESTNEIKKIFKKATSEITSCCLGGRGVQSVFGFKWKYKDYVTDFSEYSEVKLNDGKTYSNYKVNKNGQIINKYGRILKLDLQSGYQRIGLFSDDHILSKVRVHRVVAYTFLEPIEGKDIVNHKDKNRSNNKLENLEFVTVRENNIHATGKKVSQIDRHTGEILQTFDSISCASKFIGTKSLTSIWKACQNEKAIAANFCWKFI